MKINYNGLWKIFIDKNINKTEEKICEYFQCDIGDIIEYKKGTHTNED